MAEGFLNRAPDARLKRAEQLALEWEDRPPLKYEDPAVAQYAELLYALNQLPFQGKERYLAMHPVLAEVHYLLSAAPTYPRQYADANAAVAYKDRALIKALILCGCSAEDIASYLGFKTKAIELFETLAFNVRHRLKERGYIHNYVLSMPVTDHPNDRDFEQLILRQAYSYGLKGIMPYLGLALTEEDEERVQDQIRRELGLKALTAVRSMPINSHTAVEIVSQNASYAKNKSDNEFRERALGGAGGGGVNKLEEQTRIIELLGGVGLCMAPTAVPSGDEQPAIEQRVTKTFEAEVLAVLNEEAEAEGESDG